VAQFGRGRYAGEANCGFDKTIGVSKNRKNGEEKNEIISC